jgi:hypothetical protein
MVYSKPARVEVAGLLGLKFELCSTDVNLVLLIQCLRDSGMNSLRIDDDMITSGILMESDTLKARLQRERNDTATLYATVPPFLKLKPPNKYNVYGLLRQGLLYR